METVTSGFIAFAYAAIVFFVVRRTLPTTFKKKHVGKVFYVVKVISNTVVKLSPDHPYRRYREYFWPEGSPRPEEGKTYELQYCDGKYIFRQVAIFSMVA